MNNLYKILFILLLCIGTVKNGNAQATSPFQCGTVTGGNQKASVNSFNTPVFTGSCDLRYLETFPKISFNIHFWIITNGTPYSDVTSQDIDLNMNIINEMFKPMGICFVLHGIGYIQNSAIYSDVHFGTILNYATQNGYYVPNCLNVYLPFKLLDGNGVTNIGSDKLAMQQATILGTFGAARGVTLAHEIAHDFGLLHPWGGANNTIVTAERVTRDPNDPHYNALTTGDCVHDTPAMVSFWGEASSRNLPIQNILDTANCEYLGILTDSDGVPFQLTPADVGNPMAYTWEQCVTGFTVGQGVRMREYIAGSPDSPSVLAMVNTVCTDCFQSLSISDPVRFSENFTAVNNITASSKIDRDIKVIFSGDNVILQPGFDTTGTDRGYFIAEVDPCDLNRTSPSTNMKLSSSRENKASITSETVFNMAPNPAHSSVTITSTKEINSIMIISLDGKILYNAIPNRKVTTMDLVIDTYSDGIYNIVVTTTDGMKQIKKLVKN